MKSPFFSILLPTKNRPEYLEDSIRSVLWQNFDDYELIISDNCNDQKTITILDRYRNHPKINIVRPESELSMPDNWEFASIHAVGKYWMVLPDRKLLYNDALKIIHKELKKFNEPDACSWTVKVYDDLNRKMGWFPPQIKTKGSKLFTPKLLAENFINEKYLGIKSLDFFYPKSLNGCFKNEIAKKAREITGHFFNNLYATTPDYSSLFIQLAFSNKILFIGKPIYLSQGEITSNGRISSAVDCMPYLKSLRFDDYYRFVPVKAPYIYNLLLNDFICIKTIFERNLFQTEVNWINYFASLHVDLESIEQIGLMNEKSLNLYRSELKKQFELLSSSDQEKISCRIGEIKKDLNYSIPFFRNFFLHLKDYINHNFSNFTLVNNIMHHKFNSGLEAAGFKSDKNNNNAF